MELERHLVQGSRGSARPGACLSREEHAAFGRHHRQPGRGQREHSCLLWCGYDSAKKLSGRKRFVMADVLGGFVEVEVLPASVPERAGAELLSERLHG